jgi:hypothetical protein
MGVGWRGSTALVAGLRAHGAQRATFDPHAAKQVPGGSLAASAGVDASARLIDGPGYGKVMRKILRLKV